MKRYEQGSIGMRPDPDGAWVSYEDAAAAVKKATKLERDFCAKALEESVVNLSACPRSTKNDVAISALKEHAQRLRNRA